MGNDQRESISKNLVSDPGVLYEILSYSLLLNERRSK